MLDDWNVKKYHLEKVWMKFPFVRGQTLSKILNSSRVSYFFENRIFISLVKARRSSYS